jgi:ParB family transcriptional regulator, chromosome partitioning protein
MTTTAEKVIDRRRALGRGLDSLLPSGPRVVAGTAVAAVVAPTDHSGVLEDLPPARPEDAILRLPLDQIDENPYQTRLQFNEQALQELAESIRANGIVQPIVVRPSSNGRFALVLGERRCRAAKLAGEATVPAIVRQASNEQAAEMTIVENLQRQDLNCLEQAKAFSRLSREFGLTQEQIGQRTGCSRESVANYMRLLKLPEEVQQYLAVGELGFSEARVLLQLNDPQLVPGVARQAIDGKMSVAQLAIVVDRLNSPQEKMDPPARVVDPNVRAAEFELARLLGCKVRINDRKGKGRIVIEYASLDDFDRVLEMLKGDA